MATDPDVLLARLRDAHRRWQASEAMSVDENAAAEQMAMAFADLDAGLTRGGALPAAWRAER